MASVWFSGLVRATSQPKKRRRPRLRAGTRRRNYGIADTDEGGTSNREVPPAHFGIQFADNLADAMIGRFSRIRISGWFAPVR